MRSVMVKTLLHFFPVFCGCKKCENADFNPTDPAALPHWMGERETYTKIVYMAVEAYHKCQVTLALIEKSCAILCISTTLHFQILQYNVKEARNKKLSALVMNRLIGSDSVEAWKRALNAGRLHAAVEKEMAKHKGGGTGDRPIAILL